MTVLRARAVLAVLALAACDADGGGPAPGREAAAAAPSAAQAVAEPAAPPLDSAAIEAAMSADDSLEAYNRRSFERRRRSMATREVCLAQARQLPPGEVRERIERDCAARLEGR